MSGSKAERSKNDTWGEKELARYIGKEAKKRTADPYGTSKVLSKERTNKQSSSSSRRPKDTTSSQQPPKPSPATTRKPERTDPARATDTKTAGSRSKQESSRHGADRPKDTIKPASSQDGTRKRDVKPSKSSRGDLGGRSRQSGSNDADRKRTRGGDVRPRESSKSSEKRPKAGVDSHDGKERERERERGKSHGKDKELKSGASKLQSVSGSSITRSSHFREPGGPLSDALLDREKQRRSSDKKHMGREGDEDKNKRGGKIVVREDPPDGSRGLGGEVEEEEGMVVERVESGGASHRDTGAVGGPPAQPMVEVGEELVEEEYPYEEEFEDYEEDFEEELEASSESEGGDWDTPAREDGEVEGRVDLVEILQAIDAENKMVDLATTHEECVGNNQEQYHSEQYLPEQTDPAPSAPPLEYSPGKRFVDFSTARQREVSQRVAKKTRKRGQELLTMIDLDIAVYDQFDLPPLSEYEVYIKNFGSDNTRQVLVQTGEDNSEKEVQTDEIACSDKWVQWPPEDLKGYGGPSEDEAEESVMEHGASLSGQSVVRLLAFLKSAGQVCSVLLEENLTAQDQVSSQSSQSRFPFCSSCLRIQPQLSLLDGRCPMSVQFCPSQPNLLLTAYSSPPSASYTEDETGLRRKGVLCVWNSIEPSQPLQVLTCESTPTCCCFSPQKASLVFAGNEDGSVVLWDLREPLTMHKPPPGSPLASLNFLPRSPTFSTAGIPSLDFHKAPLISIIPMSSDVGETATSLLSHTENSDEEVTGLSFQLATLDGSGRLNVWVVVEIYRPDPHGSDSDLGLVPGGRVKLVKSASLDVCTPYVNLHSVVSMVQVHCFCFHPTDTNHLYIGTDTGRVYHHTRYGKRPIPRYYLPNSESNACVCDVVSMSFCPWQPDYFLVGCSDGALQLYHIKRAHPLVCWPHSTGGVAVKSVQWAEHQPGVFLVQDCQSSIYLWDLLQNDALPTFKDQFKASITYSSFNGKCQPAILLAFTNGAVEVHHLKITSEHDRDRYLLNYFDTLV